MSLHEPIKPYHFPNIQKVLPAVYDDSLSYYEVLCKVLEQLNQVTDGYNSLYDAMTVLEQAWEDFKDGGYLDSFEVFVTKWFDEHQEYINIMLREGFGGEIIRLDERITATYNEITAFVADGYVPFPSQDKYGTAGQVLGSTGNGETVWQNPVVPSDEQAEEVITEWLDEHPEATTTVQDNSISTAKLMDGSVTVSKLGEGVPEDSSSLYSESVSVNVAGTSVIDSIVFVKGTRYLVECTEFSITGDTGFNVYPKNDLSRYLRITGTGKYTWVATSTNVMRVYTQASACDCTLTIRALPYGYLNIDPLVEQDNTPDDSGLFGVGVTTKRISSSITQLNRSITTAMNAQSVATDYMNFTQQTDAARFIPPFRVRNKLGYLMYSIVLYHESSARPTNGTAGGCFDAYGNFVKRFTYASDFDGDRLLIPDNAYYVCLQTYVSHGNTSFEVEQLSVEWLGGNAEPVEETYVIDVNGNGDFTSTIECFQALAGDSAPKTIYINGGVYDVFQEMGGAEYIATIDNPSALNWRDVSVLVPPNTKLIGRGNVTLKWQPSSSVMQSMDMAMLFSPLNVDGNIYVENLTVICQNGRYAIHDECSGANNNTDSMHVYKNMNMIHLSDAFNNVAFGCGYSKRSRFVFDNCVFNAEYPNCLFIHDWGQTTEDGGSFTFSKSVFSSRIRFGSSLKTAQTTFDKVIFDTCEYPSNAGLLLTSNANANSYPRISVRCIACTPMVVVNYDVLQTIIPEEFLTYGG